MTGNSRFSYQLVATNKIMYKLLSHYYVICMYILYIISTKCNTDHHFTASCKFSKAIKTHFVAQYVQYLDEYRYCIYDIWHNIYIISKSEVQFVMNCLQVAVIIANYS